MGAVEVGGVDEGQAAVDAFAEELDAGFAAHAGVGARAARAVDAGALGEIGRLDAGLAQRDLLVGFPRTRERVRQGGCGAPAEAGRHQAGGGGVFEEFAASEVIHGSAR